MNHRSRRDALRTSLPDDVEALLVTALPDVRYLSGYSGSHGAVLVAADPDDDRLATDFRYETQAAQQCPDIAVVIDRRVQIVLAEHAAARGIHRLGFDAAQTSVAEHAALVDAVPATTLVATRGLVEDRRVVKDDDELERLTAACRISDEALAVLLPEVGPGLTERQVARRLEWLMLEAGAEAVAFPSIVASGPNSAIPHHDPGDRVIERGDLLKIDFGARVEGYHADETRTFVVGSPPTGWQTELHALVAEAQRSGVAALAVGAGLAEVDAAARSVIHDAGFGDRFGHGLGHGVGLEIHEAPFLMAGAKGILGDRTPVTVEPGVYLPGRGGVRIEDTLVVLTGGPVSLTTTTRELLVL